MPLGTSALLLSENRLEAPLAKITQLLIQKLVLSCGDDREKGPRPGLRLPGKVLLIVFMGKGNKGELKQGNQSR